MKKLTAIILSLTLSISALGIIGNRTYAASIFNQDEQNSPIIDNRRNLPNPVLENITPKLQNQPVVQNNQAPKFQSKKLSDVNRKIEYNANAININYEGKSFKIFISNKMQPIETSLSSRGKKTEKNYESDTFNFKAGSDEISVEAVVTNNGVLILTDSKVNSDLYMNFEFEKDATLKKKSLKYLSKQITDSPMPFGDIQSNESAYFTGALYSLRLSKREELTPIGSFAYNTFFPGENSLFIEKNGKYNLSVPLKRQSGYSNSSFNLAFSDQRLIRFENKYDVQDLLILDAKETTSHYHLRSDGIYALMPDNYITSYNSNKYNPIYLRAAAWILAFGIYENEDSNLFQMISKRYVYSYLNMLSPKGYIPTYAASKWLKDDYGIGQNFYDTRFNTDTMMKLIAFDKNIGDEKIKPALKRYADFYMDYYKKHSFLVYGSIYVGDYADEDMKPNNSLVSLNHYLMEGMVMIEIGDYLGEKKYSDLGYEILKNIDSSYSIWIKPNKDLHYGMQRNGQMVRNDYVSVTYNDLHYVLNYLRVAGKIKQYPGLMALYNSKRNYLVSSGLMEYVKNHPLEAMEVDNYENFPYIVN